MNKTEIVKNVNAIDVENRKLKFGEKLAAVINSGTGTFHFQMIQMFLLFFYTDVVKISPAYVAGLFLITRVFDAFLAPVFGIVVDKITTPWGKYKPWVIGITVGSGIFGWLAFTNFNLTGNGKIVYVTITYILYSITMAIGAAPIAALTPAVTKRIDERVSMGQLSYYSVIVGALIVTMAVQPLYKVLGGGNDSRGFFLIMGAFAVISILIGVYQNHGIKERYIIEPDKNENKHSLKEMFAVIFTNKTAIIVYIYVFATNLANGIRTGASIYYFKYYFHNEGLLVVAGMVSMLPTMIGVVLSSKITKRIGIKKNLTTSALVTVIVTAVVIFVPSSSIGVIMYMVLFALMSFFAGLSNPAQATMMPAAMDYTEWKNKLNINGFMGSFSGFLQSLATALSGAITAGMLAFVGYVGGAVQSSGTIFGLKVLMSILPAFVAILTLSVIWFDLTEDKQAKITKELEKRRKNVEGNVTV